MVTSMLMSLGMKMVKNWHQSRELSAAKTILMLPYWTNFKLREHSIIINNQSHNSVRNQLKTRSIVKLRIGKKREKKLIW